VVEVAEFEAPFSGYSHCSVASRGKSGGGLRPMTPAALWFSFIDKIYFEN
jgi:hypothetical protein